MKIRYSNNRNNKTAHSSLSTRKLFTGNDSLREKYVGIMIVIRIGHRSVHKIQNRNPVKLVSRPVVRTRRFGCCSDGGGFNQEKKRKKKSDVKLFVRFFGMTSRVKTTDLSAGCVTKSTLSKGSGLVH